MNGFLPTLKNMVYGGMPFKVAKGFSRLLLQTLSCGTCKPRTIQKQNISLSLIF